MSSAYTFDLPRSFDPCDFLPSRLLTRADDARWLISTIIRRTAARDIYVARPAIPGGVPFVVADLERIIDPGSSAP